MNRRMQGAPLGPKDRIAAFAKATEVYAESLGDADLANVYFGKSLGLWQAVAILSAEDQPAGPTGLRGPSTTRGARRADRTTRALQPVTPAILTRGWEDILIPLAEPASSGSAGGRGHPSRRRSLRPSSKTA